MTRSAPRAGGDLHARFQAWLVDGAPGDLPRDVALHAAYCPGCRASMAAMDALTDIDTGVAPTPAARSTASLARRGLFGAARAGVAAIALLVLAAGAGLAASSMLEAPAGMAEASPTPVQQVLGGVLRSEAAAASLTESTEATSSVAATSSALAGPSTGPALPSAPAPAPTAGPTGEPPASQSLRPTATARPSSSASSTPAPTATPTAAPTPPPTAAPTPVPDDCEDGIDNDGDTLIDISDPGCRLDGNEASA